MVEIKKDVIALVDWLSSFGKDPKGGVSRLLYTKEWKEAQEGLKALMEKDGLTTTYDEIGNLFGRLEGSKYKNETIMSGSHVDTVVNGGTLDGQYGIIAALLAVRYLKEQYGQPLRNLEIVSLAEEEGSRFPYTFWGSKNIFGIAKKEDVQGIADFNGVPFEKAMKDAGFEYRDESKPLRDDLKAFVEIHIEQGSVLEKEKKSVGVVHSIVGQRRFTIQLNGEANHAVTTPMHYRKDTVHTFSKIVVMIMDRAKQYGDPLVATVGKVEPKPNTVNVVPGHTLFTLDVRHTKKEIIVKFTEEIIAEMKKIAAEMDVEIDIDLWMDEDPVPMDKHVVEILEKQCKEHRLNYRLIHSGAGHDSQIFAPHVPTAMLFVPSIKGISHNPKENTSPEDLAEGVRALTNALYELAYKE